MRWAKSSRLTARPTVHDDARMLPGKDVRGFRLPDGVVRWRWLWLRALALPVAFVVITLTSFMLFNGIPGRGPVDRACRYAAAPCTPEFRQEVERREGLDRPLLVQYGDWLADLSRWDLGTRRFTGATVESRIQRAFSASAEIVLLTAAFGTVFTLALTAVSKRLPTAADVVAAASGSVPVFALLVWTVLYPSEWWGYVPPLDRPSAIWDDPLRNLRQYVPPALLISMGATFLSYTSMATRRVSLRTAANVAALSACTALSALVLVELLVSVRGEGLYYFESILRDDQDSAQALLALGSLVAFATWLVLGSGRDGHATTRPVSLRGFVRKPVVVAALALMALFFLMGLLGPYIVPYDPVRIGSSPLETPSWSHPFGTDNLGRDLFSRGVVGARPPLLLVLSMLTFGFIPGLVAGGALGRWARASRLFAPAAGAAFHLPVLWIALAVAAIYGYYDWHARVVVILLAFVCALTVVDDADRERPLAAYGWRQFDRNAVRAIAVAAQLSVIALTIETSVVFLGFGNFTGDFWGADLVQARNTFPAHSPGLVLSIIPLVVTLFGFSLLAVSARRAMADAEAADQA